MFLQWSLLKSPPDLRPVQGLVYLEMDDSSSPDERVAVIEELQNQTWIPRNDLTGGDATDAAMAWSIWEAPAQSTGPRTVPTDIESLRSLLRDRPGARFLNPVFALSGEVDSGLFSYGKHVIAAIDRAPNQRSVRDLEASVQASGAVLRAIHDLLPALRVLPFDEFQRCWVLTLPAHVDGLTLATGLREGSRRFAEPSWIQLNVPLGADRPCDESKMPADWWVQASRINVVVDRATARMAVDPSARPVVAVLDVGFDEVDGHRYRHDYWGKMLDAVLERPAYPSRRPDDLTMHGTRCASVIACGKSGQPNVLEAIDVLPIRVGTGGGRVSIEDLDIALGLLSAWLQGATVMSLSIQMLDVLPLTSIVLGFADLVDVVVIASSGNYQVVGPEPAEFGTSEFTAFPALHPTVLAVGGFDYCGEWAQWTTKDGEGNPKTTAARWRGVLDLAGPAKSIPTITTVGGDVGSLNGTSLAAPIVAGVAALLRVIHPTAPSTAVRDSLRLVPTGGNERLGNGPMDAAASLGWLDIYMMNHEENDTMPVPPNMPALRTVDWMSFLVGLTLGLVIGLFVYVLGAGGFRRPGADATLPGEPHQPVPLAFGDLKDCSNTALSGTYTATLEVKTNSGYVQVADAYMPGTYDYHYDFGNLVNTNSYRIRLIDDMGRTVPAGSCGKTVHTFAVNGSNFEQRFDLSIP